MDLDIKISWYDVRCFDVQFLVLFFLTYIYIYVCVCVRVEINRV